MYTNIQERLQSITDIQKENIDIIVNHYEELKRYCTFLTKNVWDGEDLAQETVCKVLQKYMKEDDTTICLTLLYKVARNKWLDQIRSKEKTTEIEKEASYQPHEKLADLHATIEKMQSCLNQTQIVIFLLKDVFAYSLTEIAHICSISEGAVKASLFRSRNKLAMTEERIAHNIDREEADILIQSVHSQRPELLKKLLPTLQFTKFSSQQPLLLFTQKKSSSSVRMLCAA